MVVTAKHCGMRNNEVLALLILMTFCEGDSTNTPPQRIHSRQTEEVDDLLEGENITKTNK